MIEEKNLENYKFPKNVDLKFLETLSKSKEDFFWQFFTQEQLGKIFNDAVSIIFKRYFRWEEWSEVNDLRNRFSQDLHAYKNLKWTSPISRRRSISTVISSYDTMIDNVFDKMNFGDWSSISKGAYKDMFLQRERKKSSKSGYSISITESLAQYEKPKEMIYQILKDSLK